MKLQDLGVTRPTEHIAKTLREHMGQDINFDKVTPRQARGMLTRAQTLLKEWRSSVSRHYSEKNPDYLKLVMVEQALIHRLSEQTPTPLASTVPVDPARQASMATAQQQQRKRQIQDEIKQKEKEIQDLRRTMNQPLVMAETQNEGFTPEDIAVINQYLDDEIGWQDLRSTPGLLAKIRRTYGFDGHLASRYPVEFQVYDRLSQARDEGELSAPVSESQLREKYMGFEKTAAAVKKGGSARNPEAVAAAIGRKKYGKARFQKAAAAGKKLGEGRRRLGEASELQQAQVVLASQDMVDRIQGMMEDISEMQFKDLPALTDSIKNELGLDQASQFQSQAAAALTNLLSAVQSGKTQLEAAQGVLTGQAPQVPGAQTPSADTLPGAEPAAGDLDTDLSLDANLPPDESEEDELPASLGRERR